MQDKRKERELKMEEHRMEKEKNKRINDEEFKRVIEILTTFDKAEEKEDE